MAKRAQIEIVGLRELRRALDGLGSDIDDLKATHAEAAGTVEQTALGLVPRLSGDLASTIRSSGTKTGGRVKAGFARIPYAGPIHFGWPARNIEPQPFLYDAMDDRRQAVIDVYVDRLAALIDKHDL